MLEEGLSIVYEDGTDTETFFEDDTFGRKKVILHEHLAKQLDVELGDYIDIFPSSSRIHKQFRVVGIFPVSLPGKAEWVWSFAVRMHHTAE